MNSKPYFFQVIELKKVLTKDEITKLIEKITLLNTKTNKDDFIQLLDPEKIISENQIDFAFFSTKSAFTNKINISKNINIEFLLRLSGEHNVDKAIGSIGITSKKIGILIVNHLATKKAINSLYKTIEKELNGKLLENYLENKSIKDYEALLKVYGIPSVTLETYNYKKKSSEEKKAIIENLVIEKINLIENA